MYTIKELCDVVVVFEGKRRDVGRVPQTWNCEANVNCPQMLSYTQEIRGKNRSRQWSPRGQKLYQKKNLLAPGLHPEPRWGAYSAPHPPQLFRLRLPICPPPRKNPAGAHGDCNKISK